VPAPPPRISPRGRVLPRLQAPRHPPSAHKCRASRRSAERASVPHAGLALRLPGLRSEPSPGHGAFVHLFLLLLGIACVRCTHDLQPASLRSHRSGMTPARIGGPGNLGSGRHRKLSKCGENRGTNTERRMPRRWSRGDSNPGPPPCKGGALPAKLRPHPRVHPARLPRPAAVSAAFRWARLDSNQGPRPYQGRALTS
jgi:hypothetical protein